MKCPLCGYEKPHKHGLASKGSQRYFCPKCQQTFTDTFDTLYYRRQVSEEDVRIVLQAQKEGSSVAVGASKRWGKGERIRENREVYKKGRIDKRHALGK
jgi:transcriptional regulator NrdR family protein